MISLVVTFNKNISYRGLLSNLSASIKKIKDVEIIFVVQIMQDNKILNLIDKFEKDNPNAQIKIIFSSKNISFNNQIFYAQKEITKKYVYLLDPSINLEKSFFQSINKIIQKFENKHEKKELDIIEFNSKFRGNLKWESQGRINSKQYNTFIDINKENSIIAFSYPFIFNKIFSKKILFKIFDKVKNFDSQKDTSTIYSIYLNYEILLNTSMYCFINERLITIDFNDDAVINYSDLIKEWGAIKQLYLKENKYLQEMKYAKLFHLQIILPSIYSSIKTSRLWSSKKANLLQKKYYDKLLKIRNSEFEFFDVENKYINISMSNESNLLKQIIPINKWSKILSSLEKK